MSIKEHTTLKPDKLLNIDILNQIVDALLIEPCCVAIVLVSKVDKLTIYFITQ